MIEMNEGGVVPFRATTDELNISFADCFSYGNLVEAAIKCAKGVRWKRQVQSFMADRIVLCGTLYRELHSGTYQMRKAEFFHIIERGKPRDVKSIYIGDRVVQRCLADHVLVPLVKGNIIDDNSACLQGRGLDYAFNRVRQHLSKMPSDGYILQFDFHDYFHTIDKDKLIALLGNIVLDERLMLLFKHIIYSEERGLELGSHISQLCAVFYLHEMDMAFVNNGFAYHRYMDDGIVFCKDKGDLAKARSLLFEWVEKLGLEINEKKLIVSKATQPFIFCKARFRKRKGKVTMNVTKKSSRRTMRRFKKVKRHGFGNLQNVEASILGYLNRGDADLSRLVYGA